MKRQQSGRTSKALAALTLALEIIVADKSLGREHIRPRVILYVINEAGVADGTLRRAQKEAAAIFGRAGLDLVWIDCEDGHADCTSDNPYQKSSGTADFWLRIEIPSELERYVVFKGSLSIEGISLTVAKIDGKKVTVAIIPHTWEMTNLKSLKAGDPVNLEADMIAKYVEKMMRNEAPASSLTVEELVRQGF